MILEKAYAKLHSSYSKIEGGKVHFALADMTGGVPEMIDMKRYRNKVDYLWTKIKNLHYQNAFMGVGTSDGGFGDRRITPLGIVQGHAYAILDMKEVDEFKLIKLRNPHGSRGVEWNGDWSDNSDMWSTRTKNICGYVNELDGAFWMNLYDFIDNFNFLYLCRTLDTWYNIEFAGEWKGETAEGLPSKEHPKVNFRLNPQYEISIETPCSLFIQLTQEDQLNMFAGNKYIMFLLQKTNGGKFGEIDSANLIGISGRPNNMHTVSAEIELKENFSYPLKASLLVSNTGHGPTGEGKYKL